MFQGHGAVLSPPGLKYARQVPLYTLGTPEGDHILLPFLLTSPLPRGLNSAELSLLPPGGGDEPTVPRGLEASPLGVPLVASPSPQGLGTGTAGNQEGTQVELPVCTAVSKPWLYPPPQRYLPGVAAASIMGRGASALVWTESRTPRGRCGWFSRTPREGPVAEGAKVEPFQ